MKSIKLSGFVDDNNDYWLLFANEMNYDIESIELYSTFTFGIDLSYFPNLKRFICINDQLESINLKNCKNLQELRLDMNNLKSVDLSECPNLKIFSI